MSFDVSLVWESLPQIVGGIDPCGIDRDPKGQLDAIFGLCQKYGKPLDIHLHEPGEMGAFSMDLIFERTRALGMKGQVVISHAFCLGTPDRNLVDPLIDAIAELDIGIMTTASASRPVPAVKPLLERAAATVSSRSAAFLLETTDRPTRRGRLASERTAPSDPRSRENIETPRMASWTAGGPSTLTYTSSTASSHLAALRRPSPFVAI